MTRIGAWAEVSGSNVFETLTTFRKWSRSAIAPVRPVTGT